MTTAGIEIVAQIAEGFPDADHVWKMIQAGLVTALSIGFRAIEQKRNAHGGITFTRIDLFELSVVAVPMNADAVITSLHATDAPKKAASHHARPVVHLAPPVTAPVRKSRPVVKLNPRRNES